MNPETTTSTSNAASAAPVPAARPLAGKVAFVTGGARGIGFAHDCGLDAQRLDLGSLQHERLAGDGQAAASQEGDGERNGKKAKGK